ncbi:MAG TPA: hypothetical protein VMJ65_16765 [Solirubrobacteraceae bacterium]|nr:hypothetical protein [Solirubrobacteraceae bacterium]
MTTTICAHLDEIVVPRPDEVAGCEDWSYCYVDEAMFVVQQA